MHRRGHGGTTQPAFWVRLGCAALMLALCGIAPLAAIATVSVPLTLGKSAPETPAPETPAPETATPDAPAAMPEADAALPLTQEEAEVLADALVQEEVARAMAAFQDAYGLTDALTAWLLAQRVVSGGEGGVWHVRLPLPAYKAVSTELPAYDGQEPIAYLQAWVPALVTLLSAQKPSAKAGVEVTMENGALAQAERDALGAWIAEELQPATDTWAFKAADKSKALRAFSRLLLPVTEGKTPSWQTKQFKLESQAPRYSSKDPYAPLKKGAEGAAVRRAQEALAAAGLLAKAGSTYNDAMVGAVSAFEAAHDLPVDGALSTAELYLLYGEEPPLTLPLILADASGGLSRAEAELWWPVFLQNIRSLRWEQGETGAGPSLMLVAGWPAYSEDWAEDSIAQYTARALQPDGVRAALMDRALAEGKAMPQDALQERCFALPLALFAAQEVGADALYEGIAAPFAEDFVDFAQTMVAIEAELLTYMEETLLPEPMPPTGAILSPKSGTSAFAIHNGGDVCLYAKVYSVAAYDSTEWGELVGTLFIHPNQTASMDIKPGYYHVNYGGGEEWYGIQRMFGPQGYYNSCEENYEFLKNYTHTLSIAVSYGEGEDTQFEPIDPEDM